MKKLNLLVFVSVLIFSTAIGASAQTTVSSQRNLRGAKPSAPKSGKKKVIPETEKRRFGAKKGRAPENKPAQPLSAPEVAPPEVAQTGDVAEANLGEASEQEIAGNPQSGNVVVNINSNGNATVKLGLAMRGVTVIDFPSEDGVYKIHPGDENYVTVDCAARENGKCGNLPTDAIVLRPGKNFYALGSEESAATVVTVQRISGIVVSFIVVPVKSIARNANYVVVRYNLSEVIAARQKAGLAVNLQPSKSVLPLGPEPVERTASGAGYADTSFSPPDSPSENPPAENPAESVIDELKRVAQAAVPLRFSKPVYGLSLARATFNARTGDDAIEVIAVRNTTAQALRLVPDQPELVVENREKRNSSVNLQRLTILHTATTVEADDILEPGKVYYFAFLYQPPILGVKQVLRVSFAQREAADAPVSLELSGAFK